MPSSEKLLARIDRTPLVATVMSRIRTLIESQQMSGGERLPSERELREQLNVGRSTVREALKALEALGVVEIRHGSGIFTRGGAERLGQAESTTAGIWRLSDWAQLGPVVEARLAIEPTAAALAAQRRSSEQLEDLAAKLSAFDEAAKAGDQRALVMADVAFHGAIAEIANPLLAHCLRELGVLVINSRYISLQQSARHPSVAKRHRTIYEAIAAGDIEASSNAMTDHLTDFIHELGYETIRTPGCTQVIAKPSP